MANRPGSAMRRLVSVCAGALGLATLGAGAASASLVELDRDALGAVRGGQGTYTYQDCNFRHEKEECSAGTYAGQENCLYEDGKFYQCRNQRRWMECTFALFSPWCTEDMLRCGDSWEVERSSTGGCNSGAPIQKVGVCRVNACALC